MGLKISENPDRLFEREQLHDQPDQKQRINQHKRKICEQEEEHPSRRLPGLYDPPNVLCEIIGWQERQ
jgi:hypothetical protein